MVNLNDLKIIKVGDIIETDLKEISQVIEVTKTTFSVSPCVKGNFIKIKKIPTL